ncbi:MAG: cation ABC transporter substrate-binding protein [Melioribacteraceae bacterium]|nr:MAG: cation ABC transporter substrate-binding protein [Melioribacteraceae bacterium]
MKKIILFVILLSVLGCETKDEKDTIFVSVLPIKYFAEQIVGDYAAVEVMVPPGMSPATYEPLPAQIVKLSRAKLLFTSGVPFEKVWIKKIESSHPNLKIRASYDGIQLHEGHSHGDEKDHLDPHLWTDPVFARQISQNIAQSLIELFPDHKSVFENNLKSLEIKLDSLDRQIKSILVDSDNTAFMIFHPALGYYAERYGLTQISIEQHGKEPSPKQLRNLIKIARDKGISQIFVQEQFSRTVAESIAGEFDIPVNVINPLSDDYINNMLLITKKIAGEHE